MRCYCCNMEVSSESLDRPTGRFYCSECFQWTNDEIYHLSEAQYQENSPPSSLESSVLEETLGEELGLFSIPDIVNIKEDKDECDF